MTRCGILSPDGSCDVLLYRLDYGYSFPYIEDSVRFSVNYESREMGHDGATSSYLTPTDFRRLTGCQWDPQDRGVTLIIIIYLYIIYFYLNNDEFVKLIFVTFFKVLASNPHELG